MSKKKSKAKNQKAQKALQARKAEAKARNIGRMVTIAILGTFRPPDLRD